MDGAAPGRAEAAAPRSGTRQSKAAGAFRTISEVADELDVAQHVLRFWESKFPQVRPLKRGGGRRYYRPEDVDLLRRIRSLLYEEGYTIKGAQKLLRGQRRPGGEGETTPKAPEAGRSEATATADRNTTKVALEPAVKEALQTVRDDLVTLRNTLRRAGH
jgi:DNA-binding transcriptional MerR regulator